jgi:hypothetical protein
LFLLALRLEFESKVLAKRGYGPIVLGQKL